MVRDGRHYVPDLKVSLETLKSIYDDLDSGFMPVDICKKYQLSQQQVYKYRVNRDKYKKTFKF